MPKQQKPQLDKFAIAAALQEIAALMELKGGNYRFKAKAYNAGARALQSILERMGLRLTERLIGKSLSRWIPVLGAIGVGTYAYADTAKVAATAIELFSSELEMIDPEEIHVG